MRKLISIILLLSANILVTCKPGGNTDNQNELPLLLMLQKKATCTTLACQQTSTYNLLVDDIDGTNISVIATDSYRDMTHPRVSADKN